MPLITLPDGSKREFDRPVTVNEIAASIGAGLAKAALGATVNGKQVDTAYRIDHDAELSIITSKDEKGLEIIRHSTAHLMAQAVKQLYPEAQVTIGPVIDNGFYYDFSYPPGFSEEDFSKIEERMRQLVKADIPIVRFVKDRDQAKQLVTDRGETYKIELIDAIPDDQEISFYQQDDFTDLCRGTHVPSTGHLKHFKLMKVAGAYWRGDSSNEMLQRIYGTAWASKKDLDKHLLHLQEAEKRDHRKLGKAMDLFHFQEQAPGMVFWHEKGWTINRVIRDYIRNRLEATGYSEINTPSLVDRSLWEQSGHWDKFGEAMFTSVSENRDYAIKPMNCPCHVQVFNQGIKSYRDLPVRLAEFGSCHRNEPSGTLHGLMRVRGFVQDDAHIFCTQAQIQEEVSAFNDLLYSIYSDFGFNNIELALSTRPEQRVGSDPDWDQAEAALEAALNNTGKPWTLNPGEGAFYGPKIEYTLRDCLDRVWQCGTMQVDFQLPDRLNASYIDENGSKQVPVMLHRAVLGSLERFIGILLEHYAGKLPFWISPVQVIVLTITGKHDEYALNIEKILKNQGFRVESDLRNEKIGFKIREHTLSRIPVLLVIGDKEVDSEQVAVRTRSGEDKGVMKIEQLQAFLQDQKTVCDDE